VILEKLFSGSEFKYLKSNESIYELTIIDNDKFILRLKKGYKRRNKTSLKK
jgi:hypothetical protein